MTWPEQVPVLKPEDFVVGPWRKDCRWCLLGWRWRFFGSGAAWEKTLADLILAAGSDYFRITSDLEADTPANRRLAARIWSKFIKRLGYTEDGPIVDL